MSSESTAGPGPGPGPGPAPDASRTRFPLDTVYQAARMYYLEDATQVEIASRLGVSRPTVSRLVAEARKAGLVRIEVVDPFQDETVALAERLQASTSMPVLPVRSDLRLEADHVYVIETDRVLRLEGDELRLAEPLAERSRRMAIDLFFRTLADTHGPHATAVILSGADGDGAIGIKRIKERGGLTVAQDPQEAGHASMPLAAIATSMVDWVLPTADMPQRLQAYFAIERELKLPPEDPPPGDFDPAAAPADYEHSLREVLNLLAEGLPNKLIADRLGISDHTAKFHVNAVISKLGAQSRTEAVAHAFRAGLVTV